ncbi:MAG: glycosyltransferase family 4 protein [Candidatus Yanofskybacteria bacterium]|nr:glycosyltransferase family 4 protein [Candidatus Yanofskybacteria bacterium]
MKLLMISGDRSLAEGKRGAFYNTLEEFHKYWERIDIICPHVRNSKLEIQNYFHNVKIHPSPWPLWLQPWWILKKGREIYREQKFDLMTVHEYPPFYNGIGARWLWNKIRTPYVLEIHHIPGYPKAAGFKEWLYKIATHFFIKYDTVKAKAVRVVNRHQVPEFLIKSGVPKEKITYIPSMYVDLDIFKPTGVEKKYDLIFVGRLAKNKGIDLLLEAASKLETQIPNFKLLIVGIGPFIHFLKFKIENLKLQDSVLLYGWAKDSAEVADMLNQSKVLIMPSYNEGGPRVVLEAMACGVPVLATPVGLVTDIIKDGESGGVIDWNPADISQKALELLRDAGKYQKYLASSLEIASRFEKQAAIKNYAEKLHKLGQIST